MTPTGEGPASGPFIAAPDGRAVVLRRAIVVLAVVVPVTAAALTLITFVLGERDLLAWSILGWLIGAVCVLEAATHRVDVVLVILLTAVGVAVAAPFSPADSVITVVAAATMVAVVLFAVVDENAGTVVAAVVTFSLHAYSLVVVSTDWTGVAGAGVLFAGAIGVWLVLEEVVKRMQQDHSSYRELFDRVPVGLYRTGLGGELLDVNPALADLLGVSREELVGRRAQEFMVDVDDFSRLRAAIGDRPDPLTTDIRFRRPDGALIWVRDQTRAVTDESGEIVCFEGELQDVTDQRRHLDQLEALVRSKSELIGAVSHELRTPLTAVVGFLELLQADGAEDERSELLGLAADQARDIAGIVDDLLTAARLDNQELVVHEDALDVRSAVTGAVTSVTGGRGGEVEVNVPEGIMVRADAARVRQVLRNLVGNAMRYGRPPIEIRVEAGDGLVCLVVADHGPAIPREVAARMFDAFFSGVSTSARQPGSIGLGLAVSQRLARLMGGDLRYARVGEQTRFTLELCAAAPLQLAETA